MTYSIIIIENDEDERFFMKQAFEASGLFNLAAILENGEALMAFLKDNMSKLPQLILTDLNMPGMNGFDIIKTLKADQALSHIPIIITSTSSTRSMIDKSLELGAAEYLIKPDSFIYYDPYINELHKMIEEKGLA